MKILVSTVGAALAAFVVTVNAQDTTVRSETKISADDAKVIAMMGCLRQDELTGRYSLVGHIAAGDELTTKSTVKTDADEDKVTVTSRSETKVDDGAIGTSGVMATYALVPRNAVDLMAHLGHPVQLAAIMVEPGEGDADVKIEEKTTVDPERGSDSTARRTTKVEVPRSPLGSYTVVSVKEMAGTCAGR